jgi:hypothetical protein
MAYRDFDKSQLDKSLVTLYDPKNSFLTLKRGNKSIKVSKEIGKAFYVSI